MSLLTFDPFEMRYLSGFAQVSRLEAELLAIEEKNINAQNVNIKDSHLYNDWGFNPAVIQEKLQKINVEIKESENILNVSSFELLSLETNLRNCNLVLDKRKNSNSPSLEPVRERRENLLQSINKVRDNMTTISSVLQPLYNKKSMFKLEVDRVKRELEEI